MDSNTQSPAEDYRDEVHALFDLSTVSNPGIMNPGAMRTRREVVLEPRVILKGNGIVVTQEAIIAYSEVPGSKVQQMLHSQSSPADLRLNIIRSCSTVDNVVGNSPSIACNRLGMEEYQHFTEPVRDRDKVYLQEKSEILSNYDPNPIVSREPSLKLGKYAKNQSLPPFYWSPAFQSLIRKQRLLRCFRYISETYCLIDVYGLGITGRVFSEGSNSGRMIIIEAYSHWNSEKHVILLPFVELRQLLQQSGQEDLIRPGRKADLVARLVDGLYFDYTVTVQQPSQESSDALCSTPSGQEAEPSGVPVSDNSSSSSPCMTPPDPRVSALNVSDLRNCAIADDLVLPHTASLLRGDPHTPPGTRGAYSVFSPRSVGDISPASEVAIPMTAAAANSSVPAPPPPSAGGTIVQTVSHLESFALPAPYPSTVSSLLRLYNQPAQVDRQGNLLYTDNNGLPHPLPLPKLTQELKLSDIFSRPSAAAVRAARVKEEEIDAARQEAARTAAWLAIPRRKRGFITSRCLRAGPRIFVLSAYIMPSRPTVALVKGHAAVFCHNRRRRLQTLLALSALQATYDISDKPSLWSDEMRNGVVQRAVGQLQAIVLDPREGVVCLGFKGRAGGDYEFPRLRGVNLNVDLHDDIKSHLRLATGRRRTVDNRSQSSGNSHIALFTEYKHARLFNNLHLRDGAYSASTIVSPWPAGTRGGFGQNSEIAKREASIPGHCPCPRRYLGTQAAHRRLCTGSIRIQGMDCIFTVRQLSKAEDHSFLPKIPPPQSAVTGGAAAAVAVGVRGTLALKNKSLDKTRATPSDLPPPKPDTPSGLLLQDYGFSDDVLQAIEKAAARPAPLVLTVMPGEGERARQAALEFEAALEQETKAQQLAKSTASLESCDEGRLSDTVFAWANIRSTAPDGPGNAVEAVLSPSGGEIVLNRACSIPALDSASRQLAQSLVAELIFCAVQNVASLSLPAAEALGASAQSLASGAVKNGADFNLLDGREDDKMAHVRFDEASLGDAPSMQSAEDADSDSDDDDDEPVSALKPPTVAEKAGAVYMNYARYFEVEIELYVPHGGLAVPCPPSCPMSLITDSPAYPSCHRLKRRLYKEQLLQQAASPLQLLTAMLVNYAPWHAAAGERDCLEMEAAWRSLTVQLLRRARWVIRSERGQAAESDLHADIPVHKVPQATQPLEEISPSALISLATEPAPTALAGEAEVGEAEMGEGTEDPEDDWIRAAVASDAAKRDLAPVDSTAAAEEAAAAMKRAAEQASPIEVDGTLWAKACQEEALRLGEIEFAQQGIAEAAMVELPLHLPILPPHSLPGHAPTDSAPSVASLQQTITHAANPPEGHPAGVTSPEPPSEIAPVLGAESAGHSVSTLPVASDAPAGGDLTTVSLSLDERLNRPHYHATVPPAAPRLYQTLAWPPRVLYRRAMKLRAPHAAVGHSMTLLATVEASISDMLLGVSVFVLSGPYTGPYLIPMPHQQSLEYIARFRFALPSEVASELYLYFISELRFRFIPSVVIADKSRVQALLNEQPQESVGHPSVVIADKSRVQALLNEQPQESVGHPAAAAPSARMLELTFEVDDEEIEVELDEEEMAFDEEEMAREARGRAEQKAALRKSQLQPKASE